MGNMVVIGLAVALGVGVILAIAWYDARPLNKFRQQSRREARRRRAERAPLEVTPKGDRVEVEQEIQSLKAEIAERQARLNELQATTN
ncbi:MAG: hypothetical protein AAGI53_02990 [Planctomycetota bacterium]